MLDLDSIRRMLDADAPIPPWLVRALVERCERQDRERQDRERQDRERQDRELLYERGEVIRAWAESMGWETEALAARPVVSAARAWADAVERCDGIAAAAERLREAVRGL